MHANSCAITLDIQHTEQMYFHHYQAYIFLQLAGPPSFRHKTVILPPVQQMSLFRTLDYQALLKAIHAGLLQKTNGPDV